MGRPYKPSVQFPHSFRVPLTTEQYRMLKIIRGYSAVSLYELFRGDLERHYYELVPSTKKPRGPKASEVVSVTRAVTRGSE
jgi:hypothetical protein